MFYIHMYEMTLVLLHGGVCAEKYNEEYSYSVRKIHIRNVNERSL